MQRFVRIDHAFAIMTRQVTVAEFLQFRKDHFYRKYFSPEPGCPMNNVTWYDAIAYCNWLNAQEGVPEDQWCYQPNDSGQYAQGMRIVPDALRRTGYRLPTEEEWEFACRVGAVTSRFYGQDLDLDNHYACSVQNSMGRRTALVGSYKPNDLGLFDMLGNTLEWSHSLFRDPSLRVKDSSEKGPVPAETVLDRHMRTLKGATLAHPPETIRAAFVDLYPPSVTVYGVGLRLSRTYPLDEISADGMEMRDEHRLTLRSTLSITPDVQTRTCYRTGHKANFPLFAFGIRTARTVN